MEYGYVRVSSKDQNIARQMAAMYEVGIDDKHIYIDKFSGKDFKRPHYKRMVKKLKAGIYCTLNRLTDWEETTMKLLNNGVF